MARSYTTNFNLVKRDEGDIDWADDVNGNMDTIDEEIHNPLSHNHLALAVDNFEMNAALHQFGRASVDNVDTVDAGNTYTTGVRDLINELKSQLNALLTALYPDSGCGVLGSFSSSSSSSISSSNSISDSTSVSSSSTSTSVSSSSSSSV